jgi:hypothetical protein
LNFSGGSAVPLTGSSVPGFYSMTVSYSDPYSGDLLFYGNEAGLWDRFGSPFPTCVCPQFGSAGDPNIIALPGTTGIYYLFYSASYDSVTPTDYSLRYAVIDMALNGGLGDVASAEHVIAVNAHRYAILPAVGQDSLWLVTEIGNSNGADWYSYPITVAGIGPAQWVNPSYPWTGGQGVQLGDRSGTRFISSTSGVAYSLFDFDPATGLLFDFIELVPSSIPSTAEFSPDGEKLYVLYSGWNGPLIDQFDLNIWDQASIMASRTTLAFADSSFTANRDIRLGPDGRLYLNCGSADSTSVWMINEPNLPGVACGLMPYSVPLSPDITAAQTPRFPIVNWPRPLTNVGVPNSNAEQQQLLISPNPAQDHVTAMLPDAWRTGGSYRWLDALGREVAQGSLPSGTKRHFAREAMPAGCYLLELRNSQGQLRAARVLWE